MLRVLRLKASELPQVSTTMEPITEEDDAQAWSPDRWRKSPDRRYVRHIHWLYGTERAYGLEELKKEKAVCKGSLKSMNDHLEQFAKLKKEVAKKDGERGPGPSAESTSGCCK